VGEIAGDTGTREMEALLKAEWGMVGRPVELRNWGNTCYALTLWERREGGKSSCAASASPSPSPTPSWPLSCASCGAVPPLAPPPPSQQKKGHNKREGMFYRDRLTRAVAVCSMACARSPEARRALGRELRRRHIALPGPSSAGDGEEEGEEEEKGLAELPEALLWRRVRL
jgi:hypothetical protein